jgi:hypothetical protein
MQVIRFRLAFRDRIHSEQFTMIFPILPLPGNLPPD